MNRPDPVRIAAASLSAILDRHERQDLFSGSVLVTRENDVLLHEARGRAHRGFSVPNTPDTRFDTASLGKRRLACHCPLTTSSITATGGRDFRIAQPNS